MDSSGYMTCSLKVDTQSPGWQRSLTKVLRSIKGVSFSIDASQGLAHISCNIDPNTILRLLAKAGKHAELCRLDSGYNHRDIPIMHGNGFDYGYNPPYSTLDYYHDNPQQRYWYSQQPHHPNYQYYEPPAQYYPQPLPSKLNPYAGEPECSIM